MRASLPIQPLPPPYPGFKDKHMRIILSALVYALGAVAIFIVGMALIGLEPGTQALRGCMIVAGIGGSIGAIIGFCEGRESQEDTPSPGGSE